MLFSAVILGGEGGGGGQPWGTTLHYGFHKSLDT